MLRTILALTALVPPGWSQDFDPIATQPSPATRPLAQTHKLLLIGTAAPRPVDLPGVSGGFGLAEYRIEAAGPDVSTRLQELRHKLRSAALPEVHYQILTQDPLTRTLSLSDVMRLPGTVEEEASPVGGILALSPPDTDISYPTITSVTLTLNRAPARSIWTRYLTFTNHRGHEVNVPIGFAPTGGLTWKGAVSAAGLETAVTGTT
jgi:hypothetical protein